MIKIKLLYRLTDDQIVIYETETDDLYDVANIMMDHLPCDIDYVKRIKVFIGDIN